MNKYFSTMQTRIDPQEAQIGRMNYGQYRMFTGNIWDRSPQQTEVEMTFWNGTTPGCDHESPQTLPIFLINKTITSLHIAGLLHNRYHAGYKLAVTDTFDTENTNQPNDIYQFGTPKEYRQNITNSCGFIDVNKKGGSSYTLAWETMQNRFNNPQLFFLSLTTLYALHSLDETSGRRYYLHLDSFNPKVNTDYNRIQEHLVTAGNIVGAVLNSRGEVRFSKDVFMKLEPRTDSNPAAEVLECMGLTTFVDCERE